MEPHFPYANPTPDEHCFSCTENDVGEWDSPEFYACKPCRQAYEDYLIDMADRIADRIRH